MNAPVQIPPSSSSSQSHDPPEAKVQIGPVSLRGRGILFGAFLVGIGALSTYVLVTLVFGLVVSGVQLLLGVVTGVGSLLGLTVTGSVGLGALDKVRKGRRHQHIHLRLLEAGTLPRNEAIRGEQEPFGRLEAALLVIFSAYLAQLGLDPRNLSDLDLLRLRPEFAAFMRQRPYCLVMDREYYRPLYQLASVQNNTFVLEQIQRYSQLKRRVPFWQLKRVLHLLSMGRLGCSAQQTWRELTMEEILANYGTFVEWAEVEGLAHLAQFESLIESHYLELSSATPELSRDSRQAEDLLEVATQVLETPEPWQQPAERLEEMHEALSHATVLDPGNASVKEFIDQVETMKAALPDFESAYQDALSSEPDHEPEWMRQAYEQASASDNLSEESLRGHAARLYLTSRAPTIAGGPPTQGRSSQSTEGEARAAPTSEGAAFTASEPDECSCDAEIDPQVAAQAQQDF